MTLSICCITYNHEKFIAEAIESFIMQQTDFDYEIIISDDASTDKTANICQGYQAKYGDKIKLVLHTNNIGMMPNFITTLQACKGKYIALCEGDDYWADPLKLQKQVNFLEANPNYSICFHRVKDWFDGQLYDSKLNTSTSEETFSIKDLASGNLMHTPSVVFRNGLYDDFPAWFSQSFLGDYVLHMLNAQYGLIKYLPETMAVYRHHGGGVWSSIKAAHRREKAIHVISLLLTHNFDDDVLAILAAQKTRMIESYLKALMQEEDWTLFIQKLSFYAEKDAYISQKWLTEYYPQYIAKIKRSKTYKLVQHLQKGILKYKKKFG